ncbi:hypothetical protein E2562_003381 [Oryza meyeriana var. granulata]|uniref:Uncharacterized protein n=1 Tax=Oryza meyeriana var. granulata TaxID=110450 RepID=A0A6G1EEH0_9ORYZ|nr:hypothetical protein E2562_003381 [Oryza meyeriana var. granulata]
MSRSTWVQRAPSLSQSSSCRRGEIEGEIGILQLEKPVVAAEEPSSPLPLWGRARMHRYRGAKLVCTT